MKLRIRFTKEGPVRFVGHLDFMRFMQRVLKKSGLDVVYTGGFNPHMILSFAAPLGVGEETVAALTGVPVTVKLDDVRPWSPQDPFLYGVAYAVKDKNGDVVDMVNAYAGLRKIHIEGDKIYLNNKPIFLRLVLDQGFYPDGIWTSPSDEALKHDIELSMAAGFNGARLHQRFMTEMYDATKLLDPTRPCNEASGYHHAKTDLWTVHIYRSNVEDMKKALEPEDGGIPFTHHREWEKGHHGQPYINDEFGGFMFIPPERAKFADNTWGYYGMDLKSEDELCARIEPLVDYMISLPGLSGYCYTQLTDVEQEQNGVYNYDRTPKVTPGKLAKIFGKDPYNK